jgi:uncharacterized protein GlcG (DUF336 family)
VHSGSGTTSDTAVWRADLAATSQEGHCGGGGGSPEGQLLFVITVVDTGEYVLATERLDNTQLGSIPVAEGKARTAVLYRRPSKAFEDAIAAGGIGLRVLGLGNAVPYEGGVPILVDGKIIGAIGVSGMLPTQD